VHTVRASLCRHLIPDLCTQPNSHGLVIFEGATSEDEPRASIDERGSPTGRGLFPATRTRRDASAWRTRIRGHCSGSPGLVRAVGRTGGDWGVRLLWPKQSDRESIAASGMPPSDVSTDRPVWPMTGSTLAPGPRTAATGFDPPRYSRSSMATWADHCEAALTAGQDDARGRRGVRGRSSFAAGRTWPASVAEDNRSSGRSWNWVVACRLINLNPW
jgi:hypothetical protein